MKSIEGKAILPRILCVTIYGSVSVDGRSFKLTLASGKTAFSLIWDENGWLDGNFNGICSDVRLIVWNGAGTLD